MTRGAPLLARRGVLGLAAGAGLLRPLRALARAESGGSPNIDVSGNLPALRFTMTRATDAKQVTAADYRGNVVLLYFGYTFCPDVCPLTLTNIDAVLKRLGPLASGVRVLFVSVDPDRDTLPVLREYTAAFGPQVVGLRGTPDQLAALAQRYRVAYSVNHTGRRYEVTHGSAVYAFDASGNARLLIPSLATTPPAIAATAADLRRLASSAAPSGILSRALQFLEGLV